MLQAAVGGFLLTMMLWACAGPSTRSSSEPAISGQQVQEARTLADAIYREAAKASAERRLEQSKFAYLGTLRQLVEGSYQTYTQHAAPGSGIGREETAKSAKLVLDTTNAMVAVAREAGLPVPLPPQ